jgi:23S rRNA pseudouridine1911/1915/1917 synthase
VPEHNEGKIEGPIGRDPHNRLKYAIVREGKPSITHYEVREKFAKHAELVFRLETGRTHQIRVHMASIGHPVVGDSLYGAPKELKRWNMKAPSGSPGVIQLGRNFLHAAAVEFKQPRTGTILALEAPLPEELTAFLGRLRLQ